MIRSYIPWQRVGHAVYQIFCDKPFHHVVRDRIPAYGPSFCYCVLRDCGAPQPLPQANLPFALHHTWKSGNPDA